MVDTVCQKVNPLADRRFRFEVENVPVKQVLRQRPEKKAEYKQRYAAREADQGVLRCPVQKEEDHGKIDDDRNAPVNVREQFKKIALEETRGFILV